MDKPLTLPSDSSVKAAIRRENRAFAQPYVRDEFLADASHKAKWKGFRHNRDFLKSELAKKIMANLAIPEDLPLLDEAPTGESVEAHVMQGRWLAPCASIFNDGTTCTGWEMVEEDDPIFFCLSCNNALNGGRLRSVVFPPKATKELIIEALMYRPLIRNRNWTPLETPVHLSLENADHGLPLLKITGVAS